MMFRLSFLILLFALVTSAHADGPYVSQRDDGRWLARWVEDQGVREEIVAVGEKIAVKSVAQLPSFEVELRDADRAAPSTVALPSGTPLFVMADTHGELEIAAALLRAHLIVDANLRWSFGKGHLVLLGDVFDRGPNQTELLWLIYKLEAEAQRAGGRVHLLLGNHEAMILSGDDRYLHPKYARSAKALGVTRYADLWSERTLLGEWLRNKAAILKIGDYLCVHGGISPLAVEHSLSLDKMNMAVRDALRSKHTLPPSRSSLVSFAMGPAGPLWYRGYFRDARDSSGAPHASAKEVDRIREHYGVERILVGHTRVPTITPLYDGDVVAVQVYPHRDPESGAAVMEAIRIEGERIFKARIDGSVEPLDP